MKFNRPDNFTLEITASYDELKNRGLNIDIFESPIPQKDIISEILRAFDIEKNDLPGGGNSSLQINVTINKDDVEFQMVSDNQIADISYFNFKSDKNVPSFIKNMASDSAAQIFENKIIDSIVEQVNQSEDKKYGVTLNYQFEKFENLLGMISSFDVQKINAVTDVYLTWNKEYVFSFYTEEENIAEKFHFASSEYNGRLVELEDSKIIYSNVAFEILKSI